MKNRFYFHYSLIGLVLIFFKPHSSLCQNLIITANASQASHSDTFFINDDDEQIGFRKQSFEIVANADKPGKYSFTLLDTLPVLLSLNGPYKFLIAKNDSVAIVFDKSSGGYKITGGKYPLNYTIYSTIRSITFPAIKYDMDKLTEIMKSLDSVSYKRLSVLDECKTAGGLSEDVYAYMRAYITYDHLARFPYKASPSLKKIYPQTSSSFLPVLSLDLFKQDRYSNMKEYLLSANKFVRFVASIEDSLSVDTKDNFTTGIYYALRNLEGEARARVLYFLIVNCNYGNSLQTQIDFKKLFSLIEQLQLSELYMEGIQYRYRNSQLAGAAIPDELLHATLLKIESGDTISLAKVIASSKGHKILIDFWASWCGPCIGNLPLVNKIAVQNKDLSVIFISMDTNVSQWRSVANKHHLSGMQYLLCDNFQNVFASYLLIKNIPRYIFIENGIIKNGDLRSYEFDRLFADHSGSANN